MSKEELMKIQTCVLKVNIHCDGCKQKVKKILQKIEGVFTTKIDSEQGKVTVTGSVDPSVLIKKLAKSGKHAEIWGAPKGNNNPNQSQMANQFKGMQIDNGKGGGNGGKKGSKGGGGGGGGGGNNNNGPKMGQQLNPQQMKMKGFEDLKLPPQLKGSAPPINKNEKGLKFDVPEDDFDDFSDEFDDEFTDDDDDDEFDDDEFDDLPLPSNKMKPNMMMPVMNAQKNANSGGGPAKNGGKGLPTGGGGGGSGGKCGPGGGGGGKNQNQGGGKNGGKNSGGGGGGGGGANGGNKGNSGGGAKSGGFPGGGGGGLNGGNKGNGGGGAKSGGFPGGGGGGGLNGGNKGNGGGGPMAGGFSGGFRPMGGGGPPPNMSMPMGGPVSMGNIPAVQGLPSNNAPPGYFSGSGSDPMQQQQQYLTAVMNQQRAMGNERFQPMMYARPPPAVNYMPQNPHQYPNPSPYPYSYPYPYPPPYGNDQYSHAFSDENTSSCDIM